MESASGRLRSKIDSCCGSLPAVDDFQERTSAWRRLKLRSSRAAFGQIPSKAVRQWSAQSCRSVERRYSSKEDVRSADLPGCSGWKPAVYSPRFERLESPGFAQNFGSCGEVE